VGFGLEHGCFYRALAMARRRRLVAALCVLVASKATFLYPGPGLVPRSLASRGASRGSAPLEKSEELLHQLADDMDELVKMLPEEGEEDAEPQVQEQELVQTQALVTGATEEGQVSGLDVKTLQAAPEYGENKYIATVEQIQSIVDEKVQKYTAVIKSFERYIEELEEELDKTELELEQKDKTLKEEADRRRQAEDEVNKLLKQREELEASFEAAEEAGSKTEKFLGQLDDQAEKWARLAADGALDQDEADRLEEDLIAAQAAKFRTGTDAEVRLGQLQEVQEAADEAAQRAQEAEQRQQALAEELERMRGELKIMQEQRDNETKRREVADARFGQLIQRLQERVGKRS